MGNLVHLTVCKEAANCKRSHTKPRHVIAIRANNVECNKCLEQLRFHVVTDFTFTAEHVGDYAGNGQKSL